MNEIVYNFFCIFGGFLSKEPSTAVDAFVFVWKTELLQPVYAAHTFDPVIFLGCFKYFYEHSEHFVSESSDVC